MTGTLHVVALPIGNPADVTLRALETLRSVDVVACEDTRHFATLARIHGIRTRTVSVHEHNEAQRVPELVARLTAGEAVALVSDAGTPLVSDPGFRLVVAAIAAGVPVTSLPGPSAVTTALAASGLPPQPFRFCGFAPRAAGPRRGFFAALREEQATLVCFEAPHRLVACLQDAREALGERSACLGRNLTKPHERYQRGTLGELASALGAEATVRGECTLVIAGADAGATPERDRQAVEAARLLLAEGVAARSVVALLTGPLGVPRRRAYELAHRTVDDEGRS